MAKRRTLGDTVARQAHQIDLLKSDNKKLEDETGKLRAQIENLTQTANHRAEINQQLERECVRLYAQVRVLMETIDLLFSRAGRSTPMVSDTDLEARR